MKTLSLTLIVLFAAPAFAFEDCQHTPQAQIAYGKIDSVAEQLSQKIVRSDEQLRRLFRQVTDAMNNVDACNLEGVLREANSRIFSNSHFSRLFPTNTKSQPQVAKGGRG